MALINFTNLDFDQVKQSIRDYIKLNSNFTDYDFDGSNLSVILDILAYNTYISSYNANMISNEVFLDSATLRENVVALARNIGYIPRSRKCSKANITFYVDTTGSTISPFTLTLKKGVVATTNDSFNNNGYSFCITEDKTVIVKDGVGVFDGIDIYEGTYITETFSVNANDANQRFILSNPNIDTSTISVLVRDSKDSTVVRKFNLSQDLFDVNSSSKVFFLQEIEDERYELIFGDGIFGQKLENNNYLEISYIVTSGEESNNINSFTYSGVIYDNNANIVTSDISLITANNPSDGGSEIESIESIKKYAPRSYASQNRAVTLSDYETIIATKLYPETQSISVFGGEELDPPQYGKVFIAIKPYYGFFIPNSIKDNLKNELKKYAVAGISHEFIDLKYLFVEVDSTVYYNSNTAPSADYVKNIVSNNIEKYANSTELNRYGARFKYSKFQKIIDESHESISSNITKVQMRRDLRVKLNANAQYEICFGNEFHVKDRNGYNIKSSAFNVKGFSDNLYLGDLPDSDLKTGKLFLFKLNSESEPVVVSNFVGSIDYIKGELLLNAIVITSTSKFIQNQSIIQISTTPKSNDIIGLQDLYLQLDINNSMVNMVIDTIASGSDISGTNYPTVSSYTNGQIVR